MSEGTILTAFDAKNAELLDLKRALLARLEEIEKERAEIKAKLGRTRKPRKPKP